MKTLGLLFVLFLLPLNGGKKKETTQVLQELVAEEKLAAADLNKLFLYRGEPYAWALLANEYHPDFMGHITIGEMLAPILTGEHKNYPE